MNYLDFQSAKKLNVIFFRIKSTNKLKVSFLVAGSGYPNLFPHISSSLVNVRLHTENLLSNLPGNGGWWWVVV